MIKNSQDYALQFEEVMLNGTWVAFTNYKHQLEQIPFSIINKSLNGSNTIALLTQHVNYYVEGVLQYLYGGQLTIKDQFSFTFTAINSPDEWEDFLKDFFNNTTQFIQTLKNLPETIWGQPFVKREYGNYAKNIEGMVFHCYYHLGQIAMLHKQLTNIV